MSEVRVASRYAKSLFELAVEQDKLEPVKAGIQRIRETIANNRNLAQVLKNPVIRYDYKLRILRRLFENNGDELVMRFLELLSRKNRANILLAVADEFEKLYNEHKGIVRARVTTAVALDEALRKEFETMLEKQTGKKVALEENIDPDIIGGYLLQMGDLQVDNTISGKIGDLRRELKGRIHS
jgi:F-type H+-transporting ATPase subunit delta